MSKIFCRLCLSKENLTPIFGIAEQIDSYSDILYLTTGLQVSFYDNYEYNMLKKIKDNFNCFPLLKEQKHIF